MSAEIVDEGIPIAVHALARIGMLIKGGAVEAGEPVRIVREMRRHPIQDHAEPGTMAAIDEGGEILRRAQFRHRYELPERLIAPGPAERMLHDRHQLDMGKAKILRIGNEPVGQFMPGQGPAVRVAPP